MFQGYLLGCPPSQDACHHHDLKFLVGDPNLNLHLPQASWEGGQPEISLNFKFKITFWGPGYFRVEIPSEVCFNSDRRNSYPKGGRFMSFCTVSPRNPDLNNMYT